MTIIVKVLRAVIRNDAMKADPDEIYGWRVFTLVFSACFGGMVFGWDTGAIGGVLSMPDTKVRFGYDKWSDGAQSMMEQNIVSTLQAGCFLACFFTGWAADLFGRRNSLIFTGILTTVGIVFQAASAANGTLAVMYVGRFIAGMGVGAASTLTPLVNYGCLLHVPSPAVFIVPLALQCLPAVPRWCARKDDWERATNIIVRLRGLPADSDYVRDEVQDMASQLEAERSLTGDASAKTLMREMVTIPGNRRRALISIMLMVCQQMTGVNAIIFANLGMTGTETGLFATGVYGIVKTAACGIFLVFIADSLGRRMSLLWTSIAQGFVMYLIGIYGRVEPPVEGKGVSAFGYVAIVCIYLWAAFFQFGWGPACWILVSEIPTARLRATNVALAAATQWLFNFIVARTVLTMQATMGKAGYGMFFMFGSFDLLMFIFVFFFVPETKGLSLEKMDEVFGVVDPNSTGKAGVYDENPEAASHIETIREEGGGRAKV
ncbi:to MFS quinate transporter [Geosmithia morbida]|uniref:To MFS quinate transporter n=1 Tax=Geosmithia morbida TaxID=1094350 RepID=A0A9P5D1S7_9HYPO|nr:to MFS quinate transporter [Geosmithia morbida]KAF4120781.1 to MFS quinate transporter [Geosmithia morbida]